MHKALCLTSYISGNNIFQLHHAVDNMYKTIRFILEFSAEHRDYNNKLYYNLEEKV